MQISQHPPFHRPYPSLGVPIKTSAAGVLWQGRVSPRDAAVEQMLLPGGTAAFWGWLLGRAPRWLPGCTPQHPEMPSREPLAQCLHSSTAPQIKTPHSQHSE